MPATEIFTIPCWAFQPLFCANVSHTIQYPKWRHWLIDLNKKEKWMKFALASDRIFVGRWYTWKLLCPQQKSSNHPSAPSWSMVPLRVFDTSQISKLTRNNVWNPKWIGNITCKSSTICKHCMGQKTRWLILVIQKSTDLYINQTCILSCQTCLSQVSNKRSQDPRRPSGPWGAPQKIQWHPRAIRKDVRWKNMGNFFHGKMDKTRFTSIQNGINNQIPNYLKWSDLG